MTVTIAIEPIRQPEVLALIALSDDYVNSLYPPEGNFAVDANALEQPSFRFAVARLNGIITGCCGVKLEDDGTAEIKRLFVHESGRGHGLGKKLMAFLEHLSIENGAHIMNLETGPLNTEAVSLYKALGYSVCGPFSDYTENPHSVFMTKRLDQAAPSLAVQAQGGE